MMSRFERNLLASRTKPGGDFSRGKSTGVSGTPALGLNTSADPGTSGAVLGFPENGSYDAQPARLGQTSTVRTQDAYGEGPIQRRITSVRGRVRSGNSGGPVVDGRGRVLTTIFAASTSRRQTGFGVPDSIVADALRRADERVSTGPCAR